MKPCGYNYILLLYRNLKFLCYHNLNLILSFMKNYLTWYKIQLLTNIIVIMCHRSYWYSIWLSGSDFFFFFFLWYNDLDWAHSQGFCLGTIFFSILNLTNPEKDLWLRCLQFPRKVMCLHLQMFIISSFG